MERCTAAGLLALCASLLQGSGPLPGRHKLPPATSQPVDFLRDIQPLFDKHCVVCHGPEKQRGGLRLDSGKAVLQGGDTGAVIKPGDAARSRLVALVAGLDAELKMPPKGPPLTAEE